MAVDPTLSLALAFQGPQAGQQASNWEIVAAVATALAVVVALGVSLLPPLIRHRQRPRFVVRCSPDRPFRRVVNQEGQTVNYLRAEVSNVGKRPAMNVRVTAYSCTVTTDERDDQDQDLDIDPYDLHWVSLPPAPALALIDGAIAQTPGIHDPVVHLPRGSRNFVDVCWSGPASLTLVAHDGRQRGFSYASPHADGEHRLKATITCDGCEPTDVVLRFRFNFDKRTWTTATAVTPRPEPRRRSR